MTVLAWQPPVRQDAHPTCPHVEAKPTPRQRSCNVGTRILICHKDRMNFSLNGLLRGAHHAHAMQPATDNALEESWQLSPSGPWSRRWPREEDAGTAPACPAIPGSAERAGQAPAGHGHGEAVGAGASIAPPTRPAGCGRRCEPPRDLLTLGGRRGRSTAGAGRRSPGHAPPLALLRLAPLCPARHRWPG